MSPSTNTGDMRTRSIVLPPDDRSNAPSRDVRSLNCGAMTTSGRPTRLVAVTLPDPSTTVSSLNSPKSST
jgi:hypothetical protein